MDYSVPHQPCWNALMIEELSQSLMKWESVVIVVVCRLQLELVVKLVDACLAKSSAMVWWIVPLPVVVAIFSVYPELSVVTLCSLFYDETLRSPSLEKTCLATFSQVLSVL